MKESSKQWSIPSMRSARRESWCLYSTQTGQDDNYNILQYLQKLSRAHWLNFIFNMRTDKWQTHEFIIYAISQQARADNLTICHFKKTNRRQFFMRLWKPGVSLGELGIHGKIQILTQYSPVSRNIACDSKGRSLVFRRSISRSRLRLARLCSDLSLLAG